MTADRAWRPRGPRFIPLAAIPFIVVALLPVVLTWDEWAPGFFADPLDRFATWWLGVLPSVAIPLIGAAIVIRHPRAHRTVPLLLFGATLLAIQMAGTRLVVPVVEAAYEPAFLDEPPFRLQLYQVVFAVMAVVGAFGWAYLASGLVRARRNVDVGPTWVIVAAAMILAILPTAAQAVNQDFTMGDSPVGIVLMVTGAVGLVAALVEKLAIGYFAVTATRGWLARDAPVRGWGLAALGAWVLLAVVVVVAGLPLLGDEWFQAYDPTLVFRAISVLYTAGGLALLAGFALGLPDVDGITWYDLAELDAEAARASGQARDPFDDSDASDKAEVFELEDRRLDR